VEDIVRVRATVHFSVEIDLERSDCARVVREFSEACSALRDVVLAGGSLVVEVRPLVRLGPPALRGGMC